jgi:hypothetical protein
VNRLSGPPLCDGRPDWRSEDTVEVLPEIPGGRDAPLGAGVHVEREVDEQTDRRAAAATENGGDET